MRAPIDTRNPATKKQGKKRSKAQIAIDATLRNRGQAIRKADPFSPNPNSTQKLERLKKKADADVAAERVDPHMRSAEARRDSTYRQERLQARKNKAEAARRANALRNKRERKDKEPDSAVNAALGRGKKGNGGRKNRGKNGPKGSPGGSGAPKPGKSNGSFPTASTYQQRAQNAVDLMLNPKINALLRQGDEVASEYTQQKNDLNTQTAKQLSDLQTTYKQLDNMLSGINQQTDAAYNQASAKQTGNFDTLLASLGADASRQNSGVNNELARLGISGSADQSGLESDQQFLQGLAQNNKAQAAATLAALQANAQQYGNATRSNAQGQGTQAQTVARQSAVQMLNDLLSERNQGVRDIRSQLTDVRGQRGALEQQLMEQYEQQAYDRMIEGQQQDFLNQMNVNKFNLSQDQFNADQAYRQAQLALDSQSVANDTFKTHNPNFGESSAKIKNGGFAQGFTGAQGYLQDNIKNPAREAALLSILQRIDTHKQRGKDGNINDFSQGSPTDIGKILRYAYSFLDDPGFRRYNNPRSRSLLSNAMRAYFGKL